ncbi:MAG: hypothetical protein QOG14_2338, partial [Mycobacterium sp.]|nr:hypothetical protein [Mycobacterium sp.]
MGHDRARGVEHDGVAHRALGAGQH